MSKKLMKERFSVGLRNSVVVMKRLLIFLLIIIYPVFALMQYSPVIQESYLKYRNLENNYPDDLDIKFQYAMILASMGKLEDWLDVLKQIDELDSEYKFKVVDILSLPVSSNNILVQDQDWQLDFKYGIVYLFLFKDAHGKIVLFNRRIERAQEKQDWEKVSEQKKFRKKIITEAIAYKLKAKEYLNAVAIKEPQDSYNAWGYAYQAAIMGMEDDWTRARKYCERALAIESDAYAIRAAYMEILKQSGDYLGFLKEFTTTIGLRSQQQAYEKELFNN